MASQYAPVMGTILTGIAQDGVLPGDVRKAPEADDIPEFGAAGGDALVAAGADGEIIARANGTDRRFQQGQDGNPIAAIMGQHLRAATGIGPGGP